MGITITQAIGRGLLLLLLTGVVPLTALEACSKSTEQATRFHCPMHPTYVSDHKGDCPICGMRLVPIDEKKPAVAPTTAHQHVAPVLNGQAGAAQGLWTCPMCPEVVSDKPGRCPKCKMALEQQQPAPSHSEQAGSVQGLAPIDVPAEGLQLAGVRTAVAEQGKLARTIRAVGVVRADETRIRHVHTKISGWIEKLYVNFTGEPVARGRPILSIYSQELLAAQHEYLQAKKGAVTLAKSDLPAMRDSADDMVAAARRRLELLDVPNKQVDELEHTGAPTRAIVLSAPVGGIVMSKSVFEGQQVDPGTELFTVTDLSQVWVEGDLYESEIAAVRLGQEAKIGLVNDPATLMTARIKYIYPYLNAETRTLRVRFVLPNPGMKLKLESYANIEIPVETNEGAIVPDSAVMDTGVRQIVFVNTHEGHFTPRLVKVGIRAEGRAQIVSGILPGERVVVKANFLLDSESRLRAALVPESPPALATSARAASEAHVGSHP